LENQNNKEKNCYLFATKSLFVFFPLSLQTFILVHFMKEKKTKRSKAQKTKVMMIHGREENGGGPLVVVSGKFCLIVSSQDPPTPPPHIVQVNQVKGVRMFPSMNKWQRERERREK
jgi:hypothetical protein